MTRSVRSKWFAALATGVLVGAASAQPLHPMEPHRHAEG